MSKKILITENQYQKIKSLIQEELGIADEVKRISEEIEKRLFLSIDDVYKNQNGEFDIEDFKVE